MPCSKEDDTDRRRGRMIFTRVANHCQRSGEERELSFSSVHYGPIRFSHSLLLLGNILYRFPSLQRTASSKGGGSREYVGTRWSTMSSGVEKFMEEKPWEFSEANALERAMVAGLGGLNLFGVIILGNLLKQMTMTPGGLISFAAQLFPLLQAARNFQISTSPSVLDCWVNPYLWRCIFFLFSFVCYDRRVTTYNFS
ncbi:unnamed protein product [Triticum turgidum subsp. durum]|uniref:Uncharacterized protein n=1 Tax=Triticum turgidum subsp. durum TaxID=4567 RepID=A0A9R1AZT4_TRITD|nr:unnamed protein product [Triticum turgidum subsp. durum]